MANILIWETLSKIGGGQEITLKVADILKQNNKLHFLIPQQGQLSDALEQRDITYALMGDQSMPAGNKGFKGLLKFMWLSVVALIKGGNEVRKFKPEYIYAPGPAALVWSALCARRNTKVIWHLHHNFESAATLKLINFLSTSKCVKRIISVSDIVSRQITNPKAEHKKITVYNPYEPRDNSSEKKDLRLEYPLLDSKVKIAQIGFITPTKRQDVTIDILNELVLNDVDATLAIIGSVREGDEDYKTALCDQIFEYNLSNRVVFTGYRTDVSQILSTFDVVSMPSVEGFPLVAIQAICEDVPVLSTDHTGTTEIINATGAGMIYSSDSDMSVIADTLLKTIEIDVKKAKEKHPDFLLSECAYDGFVRKVTDIFSS